MPTITNPQLVSRLVQRVDDAMRTADANDDGAVSASERATMAEDVRGLADAVASHYFSGGPLPRADYRAAYASYAADAVNAADADGDGKLQTSERSALPAAVYANVLALQLSDPAPAPAPAAPAAPSPAPAAPSASGGVLGISGVRGPSDVTLRSVVSSGLDRPTGIAFRPTDGSLWVVNRGDDSSVVVRSPGSDDAVLRKYEDDSDHFMNNPMGLAFSPVYDEFASVQDTTNDYNRGGTGNMFMGPTLWPADGSYDGGAASHLDMLHHSPRSVGIAAGTAYPNDREYWVLNSHDRSIDRYFFGEPHVHGGHDHSDGFTVRYGTGSIDTKEGVPSHLALDSNAGVLYIADTGNGRIAKLDTNAPLNSAAPISGRHGETPLYGMPGAAIEPVTGSSAGLVSPAGLVLHDDHLVVSDYATGHIKVFTKDGELVGDLDTGRGPNSITALAVGPNGKLYVADSKANEVLEVNVDD